MTERLALGTYSSDSRFVVRLLNRWGILAGLDFLPRQIFPSSAERIYKSPVFVDVYALAPPLLNGLRHLKS